MRCACVTTPSPVRRGSRDYASLRAGACDRHNLIRERCKTADVPSLTFLSQDRSGSGLSQSCCVQSEGGCQVHLEYQLRGATRTPRTSFTSHFTSLHRCLSTQLLHESSERTFRQPGVSALDSREGIVQRLLEFIRCRSETIALAGRLSNMAEVCNLGPGDGCHKASSCFSSSSSSVDPGVGGGGGRSQWG